MANEVSVVIACYNGERTIARCIDSIICNNPYEIIVVNDCSTDETPNILESYSKRFSFIKVINLEKNKGFATAEKIGIENSTGEIVFITNSDCYVPSDWISSILKHYENHNVGAVGGEMVNISNKIVKTITLGAHNCSFRKKIIEKVGNIETGVPSGEDTEFFMRIKDAGYDVIFDQSTVVLHDHPIGFGQTLEKSFNYGMRVGEIIRKYPHGKHMSKFFLFPLFWFPFKDTIPMLKRLTVKTVHNIGKFIGFLKG